MILLATNIELNALGNGMRIKYPEEGISTSLVWFIVALYGSEDAAKVTVGEGKEAYHVKPINT